MIPGGTRRRARRAALIVSVLAALGVALPAQAASPPAAEQVAMWGTVPPTAHQPGRAAAVTVPAATDYTEGLRLEASTTYTVDLAGSAVHVEYVATATNTMPDQRLSNGIRSFYFTGLNVEVVPGATHLSATQGGRSLRVSVEDAEGMLSMASIQFASQLDYRESQTVRLTYDLLPQPARSGTLAQVNAAYATFPVFVTADPGLGTISVVLPRNAEQDVVGDLLPCGYIVDGVSCDATTIADPAEWFAQVAVRDDDAMVTRTVEASGKDVHLLGWPGDDEWLDFMADTVHQGVPALERTFGRPWGVEKRLDIVETSAPYLYGYAGWYELGSSRIEIGDELDAEVALHEISHAWVNYDTFADRWITEGLAQEYASLALDALGQEPTTPVTVDESSPVAVSLVDWEVPDASDPDASAREEFGYNAAWWLTDQLRAEIGVKALSAVVAAGEDNLTPYPASTVDDRLPATPGWHSYLDLLEGLGGSEQATDLFRELAVDDADLALLDQRLEARAAYDALMEAGAGWAPPAALRSAMAEWRFDDALSGMETVQELFADRDAMAERLATVDRELPLALQKQVESAASLKRAQAQVGEADAALTAYVDAASARDRANPVTRLGLLVDRSVAEDLDASWAAAEKGSWDRARDAAATAHDRLQIATGIGAGLLLVVLLVVTGVAVVAVRAQRRRSAASTA